MAEIILYGIIGDTFDKLDAATVTAAIRAASGPLAVRINSPGGYVMEGLAIVQALRDYPGKVTIHIDGLAASMASVIAMVGTEVIMAESALMMVHKPWDASFGNADDFRRDADKLDKVEAQLIGIYARRTGLAAAKLADMLTAETWMTADEALAAGFVTSIAAPLALVAIADVSPFGFRNTPLNLKGSNMPIPESDSTQAVAAERTRISTIMSLGTKHNLPATVTQGLIERGATLDSARSAILDHLAAEGDRQSIGHNFGGHQTLDDPSTYSVAVRDALVAKISGKSAEGPAKDFQGMTVVDIARDFLIRNGERDVLRMNPDRIINMAMTPGGRARPGVLGMNAITQTTSDFPDLIGGAAETFLIDRYKTQQSQLKLLARKRNRSNFVTQYGVQTGGFGGLDQVNEAGEFKDKTISTRKEGWKLNTFGNMFNVSRQMLVNDHLGALSDILVIMAGAAAELEATTLAALINSNILLSDGVAWFHATHKNVSTVGAPLSIASLDAGRLAMRSQKDLDGVHLIDANPKYLLVPVGLQTAAETLVASSIAPTTTADVNPFAGKLVPIADPRLASATNWYLFADPDFSPALEYGYLDGQETPFVDSKEGWRVDGTEYKVRHDFGAGVMDHRMAWKNPGA